MSPKEKAAELVDKFYPRATSYSSDRKNQNENAKQCALIAVDEIIYYLEYVLGVDKEDFKYWKEVKKEIEKI